MMKYDTYKESGIEWLGNIPEHWSLVRIKEILKTQSGTTPRSNNPAYYDGVHNWIRTTDLNNSWLFESEYKITNRALEDCNLKFIPVDSVLLAMYGGFGTIGKNSLLKKESTINQSVCAILPNRKSYNPEYLYYFCKYFRRDWKLFADGARKDPNINQEAIKELFVYYPPIPEQKAIAKYLDTKTQAIDKKVSLLEKKINYYTELRVSIINDAITKGLDKNVELKDSGIDWIGQIPKHWSLERLKDSFELKTGNSISDKGEYENSANAHFYVSTKDIDFESGKINYDNGIYVPKNDKTFKRAKKDSTLICIEGANAGKKIGFTTKEVCFVNKLCSIKGKSKGIFDKYYYYFFHTYIFGNQFFSLMSGLIGGVSINQIKFLNTIIPPKTEQIKIAQYLDDKTSTIDAIVTNIGKQIDHLKELRKTLINDVVTGKIKVVE